MRLAIYIRVSTEEQAREGYSIPAQKQKLEAFALSQGWQVLKTYIDDGYSAKNLDRPQIQRLLEDCKHDLFDTVLVFKLDRIVRSVADLNHMLQLFDKYKVKFKSATEVFDTTSAMGRFFINLVASMAQWERETISERVHFVMKQKVETEHKWLSGNGPYGYDTEKGKLTINEEQAEWVHYMFERYRLEGKDTIAARLNELGVLTRDGNRWTGPRINYILKNPTYKGTLRWDFRVNGHDKKEEYTEIDDAVPAIIPKSVWEETQLIMKDRYIYKGKGNKGKYPFSGVLTCHRCGKRLHGERATIKGKYSYTHYKCGGRFRYKNCDLPMIRAELIEEMFLGMLDAPPIFKEDSRVDNTSRLENELYRIEKKVERLKDAYFEQFITKDEFIKRMKKEKDREEEIYLELESSNYHRSQGDLTEACQNLKKVWDIATPEEKKLAIHSIVENITIDVVKEYHISRPDEPVEIKFTDVALI